MKRHNNYSPQQERKDNILVNKSVKRFKGTQLHICNNYAIHPRSRHFNSTPNFYHLAEMFPILSPYIFTNRYGSPGFRFGDPLALIEFTSVILKLYYNVIWSIPKGYLCPTVPSRANYIHFIADLLAQDASNIKLDASTLNNNIKNNKMMNLNVPNGKFIKGIDIGIGANAIYSLLCTVEFGWSMIGTDICQDALDHAQKIIKLNKLEQLIELRYQANQLNIFNTILLENEQFVFTLCNPPFHQSVDQIQQNSARTLEATEAELICPGGELEFIFRIVHESKIYQTTIIWFTSLVAKHKHLRQIIQAIQDAQALDYQVTALYQGKQTRWVVAWTFMRQPKRTALIRFLQSSL